MIEERPIDLPWATAWHSIVLGVKNGRETRYWLRFYDLSYTVVDGRLSIQGNFEFTKTRSRRAKPPRTDPYRLKRHWNIALDWEHELVGDNAVSIEEEILNQGLKADMLFDRPTIAAALKPALDELADFHARAEAAILKRPWKPKVVKS